MWIDIPAHRVLEVSRDELQNDFEFVLEDGSRKSLMEMNSRSADVEFVVRKKDDKRFRRPRYHMEQADFGRIYYLEEV